MRSRAVQVMALSTVLCLLGTGVVAAARAPAPSSAGAPVSSIAAQRTGLSGITGLSARLRHSLALKSDGTAWAWGDNTAGQLGAEITAYATSSVPMEVAGLTTVTFVAAGGDHSLAVTTDGTVWAWGSNTIGQLGDGTTIDRNAPVQVDGLTNVAGGVRSVSAG